MRTKHIYCIKKIIFSLLCIFDFCGFAFYLLYSVARFSFFSRIIYALDWDQIFFNDGLIGAAFMFGIGTAVAAIIILIFYRKEISVLGRIMITLIPVWGNVSLCLTNVVFYAKHLDMLTLTELPFFIVMAVFLIKEIIKYPKFISMKDSVKK